jgi:AcrR family transcriptional regulator
MTAVTARGQARRAALLEATVELVAQRGFHGVGISEIGAAAGVSGAAIYRHFATKQDLLVALIDRAVDELAEGARAAVAASQSAEEALDALIAAHVDFALRERAVIAVHAQEVHTLAAVDRQRLRRKQVAYANLWIDVVDSLRSDQSRAVTRASVHAVFGLLNSVANHNARVPRDELAALLRAMAAGALAA